MGKRPHLVLTMKLRDQITNGALPGSVLPSETELMTEYGVSRPTARAAFTALRSQGLITVIHGKVITMRLPPRGVDRPTDHIE